MGVLSTYTHNELVPSYTRYRLRWIYTLRAKQSGTFYKQCIALYQHESLEAIKELVVNYDASYGSETEDGRTYALSHLIKPAGIGQIESEKYTDFIELDNRAGATEQKKQKALLMVYTLQVQTNATSSDHCWTSFKSYGLVRDTYYYKFLTFDANGGEGTMSVQEIENNGKLNTARFHRTGYTFQGWAKTPNGAVEYADGAEITATEADKGPVTLYAVWKADHANVVAMIEAIGEVVCTDGCKARIDAARAVYDKLSAEDKAQVTNYSVLEAAENTYAAVKDVVTKINAIGSVSYPGSGTAITTAQTAYDALTAGQKAIVINVGVLSTAQDQYAVLGVANQISAIGDVSYPESGTAIAAARTAYDALSAGQKTLVSNYGTLTATETAYQQAKEDAGNTTINFVDKDDATLRNQKRTLNYPAAPEVTDYVFQYWQTMEGSLSGGVLLVKAVYAPFGGDITLADNADNRALISDAHSHDFASVTLSGRTLYKDGNWNTICLPFDVTIAGSPLAGATARPLDGASITGTTLHLTFGDAVPTLEAGTPYIIKWESGANIVNPVFSNVTIDKTDHSYDNNAQGDTRVRFLGTYKHTVFSAEDKSILLMGGENKLYSPTSGASIGAQRAYFKIGDGNADARLLTDFSFDYGDGETTGLNLTPTLSQGEGVWYTLDGRKLQGKPTTKGVYIVNGKKTIIK